MVSFDKTCNWMMVIYTLREINQILQPRIIIEFVSNTLQAGLLALTPMDGSIVNVGWKD